MPGEHELQIALATALRERDAEKARADVAEVRSNELAIFLDEVHALNAKLIRGHDAADARAAESEEALAAARLRREAMSATPPDSGEREVLRLRWYQRPDGMWNADCACRGTLAGWEKSERAAGEQWHFRESTHNNGRPVRADEHGPVPPDPPVSLPLSLAQRILAALEGRGAMDERYALADELRKVLPK